MSLESPWCRLPGVVPKWRYPVLCLCRSGLCGSRLLRLTDWMRAVALWMLLPVSVWPLSVALAWVPGPALVPGATM